MRKPNESLDDYIVRPEPEVTSQPPRVVSLQGTGEVEILQPLTSQDGRVRPRFRLRNLPRSVRPQPLWFRRFLAAGSGALVFLAFVLVSAILVSINDQAEGNGVAGSPEGSQVAQSQEPFTFDLSMPVTLLPIKHEGREKVAKKFPPRTVQVTAPRTVRRYRELPRAQEPKFVPTTRVIYAENGVINSRIEPWLQASYKKPPGLITY